MNSFVMLMRALAALLGFFFGLFIACFLASLAGLPHPSLWGTVGWLALLFFLGKKAVESAKAERMERLRIVQASVEAQAKAERDVKFVNKPLWENLN